MGHMRKLNKNIRSTKKAPPVFTRHTEPLPTTKPRTQPRSVFHNVLVKVIPTLELTKEMTNQIAIDQPGRFPVTSFDNHKYITVVVDVDAGYITAAPIRSRKAAELVRGFTECYDELQSKGIIARLIRLDNEISATMIAEFERLELNYQLASPGDHRVCQAERAIGPFKNHFISILSGMDAEFPSQG